MPKMLNEVKNEAIAAAKVIVLNEGIRSVTIRRVATEIGVAVGTVYNYFPSKDHLVRQALHDDWLKIGLKLSEDICNMETTGLDGLIEGIEKIFSYIVDFYTQYDVVFEEAGKMKTSFEEYFDFHETLIVYLKNQVLLLFTRFGRVSGDTDFEAEFIAGALLRYGVKNISFGEIKPLILKILS